MKAAPPRLPAALWAAPAAGLAVGVLVAAWPLPAGRGAPAVVADAGPSAGIGPDAEATGGVAFRLPDRPLRAPLGGFPVEEEAPLPDEGEPEGEPSDAYAEEWAPTAPQLLGLADAGPGAPAGRRWRAFVRHGGVARVVAEGDALDAWRVEGVDAGGVRLAGAGEEPLRLALPERVDPGAALRVSASPTPGGDPEPKNR